MAVQLTAEQQRRCRNAFGYVMQKVNPFIPENLSNPPWNYLTAILCIVIIIMFVILPIPKFIAYMTFTVLFNLIVLKYCGIIMNQVRSR